VALSWHEVCRGKREKVGEDSALLRGHQAVVVALPDLDRHPNLVERHTPGRPGFERVVVRRTACFLPESLVDVPLQELLCVLAREGFLIGRPKLREHREERVGVTSHGTTEFGEVEPEQPWRPARV